MIAQQVESYLSTFNKQNRLNKEEGFLYGSGDDPVRGICVMWMATAPALAYAEAEGCNLVVCHEAVTFWDYPAWQNSSPIREPWECDRRRLDVIERGGLTVLRAHSTVDPTHVGPALWDKIALPEPSLRGWVYSHHTVEPVTVARLAERVKRGVGLDAVRVTGDPLRACTQVGTCWGGGAMDRNMHLIVQHLLPRGDEVVIVGETNDFTQRMMMDSGVAMIEAGHSPSEDPGLRRLAEDLARQFPQTKVRYLFHLFLILINISFTGTYEHISLSL